MDLALNNLQRLICHKTQPTNQVTFHGLNCFVHVIYIPQTSIHQNIAKLLTHPSISVVLISEIAFVNNCAMARHSCIYKYILNMVFCTFYFQICTHSCGPLGRSSLCWHLFTSSRHTATYCHNHCPWKRSRPDLERHQRTCSWWASLTIFLFLSLSSYLSPVSW